MTSIRKDLVVGAQPSAAWDAVRDDGAVDHLAAGFVTDCQLDGADRVVTFANGAKARERLVSVDDRRRRLVYTVVEGPLGSTHHQASVEVLDDGGGGSLFVWITDVLPDELGPVVDGLMEQGAGAIARALAG